jgi:hypothetical protein
VPVPKSTKEVGKKRQRTDGEGSSRKKLFLDLTKSEDEAVVKDVIDLTNEE